MTQKRADRRQLGAAAERHQHRDRKRQHDRQRRQHDGQRQAAPAIGRRPRTARARRRTSARRRPPARRPTAATARASRTCGCSWPSAGRPAAPVASCGPPLLVVRVAAEDDESVLLDDHAPAGARAARRWQSRRRRAGQHRLHDRPVDQRRQVSHSSQSAAVSSVSGTLETVLRSRRTGCVRQPARRRRGGACGASARLARTIASGVIDCEVRAAHRSLIAARLLYQFMKAEVVSEVVRYTAMMMAMHSTARPVWLIAVLAIDTTSG